VFVSRPVDLAGLVAQLRWFQEHTSVNSPDDDDAVLAHVVEQLAAMASAPSGGEG
jgi:hypothetical protein